MIADKLEPYICKRFKCDARYRDGHLRVLNALPGRMVLGVHTPDIKKLVKGLSCNARELIARFECEDEKSLCYEETLIWGLLINRLHCSCEERLELLSHYVPIMDNWAVCDGFCADAKWLRHVDKNVLWRFLQQWFGSMREFEVRFAVVVSMCCFLNKEWLDVVFRCIDNLDFALIKSEYKTTRKRPNVPGVGYVMGEEPYYVRMAVAWLLATALAKFPNETRTFVVSSHLPHDVVKLYVRKARESFRTRGVSPF